jgi:alcohol dehydrogenase class IV
MVISTPEQADSANELADLLGECCALRFTRARMHTPVTVTEEAVALAAQHGIDGLVSVGGGSAIGLSKAIALRTDLLQVVVPTTYSGSEMTDIVGQASGGNKETMRDPRILPEVVIYDVELTLTLPPVASVASAANAIAHAIEGLYAENTNPVIALMAEEGIRALGSAVPRLFECARRHECPRRGAVRFLALRHRARLDLNGAASQAVSCPRRRVRPAARRDTRRSPAAHDRL